MKLRITKEAPWTINDRLRTFKVGQEIEVGTDVPDNVAQDMLEHGYAEPAVTKATLVQETKAAPASMKDAADTANKKPRGRHKTAQKE